MIDGKDKDKFYIFDFCGNFEFFRMSKGNANASARSLQGALFSLKAQMAFKLQDAVYKTDELSAFRQTLVDDMVRKVSELNQDNFAVKQHLKFVELYTSPNRYQSLSYEDTLMMQQELAPLLCRSRMTRRRCALTRSCTAWSWRISRDCRTIGRITTC